MADINFFAAQDPSDHACMTYWRRDNRSSLQPWPAGARVGPVLLARDIPADLHPDERRDYTLTWYAERIAPWGDSIEQAIAADRYGAGARFASHTERCCGCSRRLESHESRPPGYAPAVRFGSPTTI